MPCEECFASPVVLNQMWNPLAEPTACALFQGKPCARSLTPIPVLILRLSSSRAAFHPESRFRAAIAGGLHDGSKSKCAHDFAPSARLGPTQPSLDARLETCVSIES